MKPSRKGTVTEYKRGDYYLTHIQWEDGHEEVEVHRCVPERLFHSCDPTDLEEAKKRMLMAAQDHLPALESS